MLRQELLAAGAGQNRRARSGVALTQPAEAAAVAFLVLYPYYRNGVFCLL